MAVSNHYSNYTSRCCALSPGAWQGVWENARVGRGMAWARGRLADLGEKVWEGSTYKQGSAAAHTSTSPPWASWGPGPWEGEFVTGPAQYGNLLSSWLLLSPPSH